MLRNIVIICLLAASMPGKGVPAQKTGGRAAQKARNELGRLSKYDYSRLLGQQEYRYLGFIGQNYQRLYIYFTRAEKDTADAALYHVEGASRVRENVCNFVGSIRLKRIDRNDNEGFRSLDRYRITGEYSLREDERQQGAGRFAGKVTVDFYVYEDSVYFDDLFLNMSDGYCNNSFEGKWTSFKTKASKKANWGLFRIPDSDALDVGECEFMVADKYKRNGWEIYSATVGDSNILKISLVEDAVDEERREWWQGKNEVRQHCKGEMLNDSTFGVKVYRNGALVQQIVCPIDSVQPGDDACGEAWFNDVTFDGHNDLIVSTSRKTFGTTARFDCYTWNEQQQAYVHIPSYSLIPAPSPSAMGRCIYGYKELAAGKYVEQKYVFRNGVFVLHAALYVDHSGEKNEHYREVRMENGREITVKDTYNNEDYSPEWNFLPF